MLGLMMDTQLMISSLLKYAATNHASKGVVSVETSGDIVRFTYPQLEKRARKLATWLVELGVKPGTRVGTIAWNTHRHLELYYAISGIGAVCHTINPRLALDDINYILDDADTQILFFDDSFSGLISHLILADTPVHTFVEMKPGAATTANSSDILDYEIGLTGADEMDEWPVFEENRAAGLCFTSGTTGKPKGVLYSHRSSVLHAMACIAPNVLDVVESDIIMPVVPMFHVNAWGIPHIAPMAGADIIMPGAGMDGESLANLIVQENVTFAAGVPTIWHGLISHLQKNNIRLTTMNRCIVGGSALPETMVRYFEDEQNIPIYQGWGMTETSPICTISKLARADEYIPRNEQINKKTRQGQAVFPIEMKIETDEKILLPWDNNSSGELYVKGPWVCKTYHNHGEQQILEDGWFATGDIAKIDPSGSMKITDRAKDIIKSGGEWISSIELEDIAMSHEGVEQAAVIGVDDERWGERPVMIYVQNKTAPASTESLEEYLSGKLPKWQVPREYKIISSLPLGATGKVLKTSLREMFGGGETTT